MPARYPPANKGPPTSTLPITSSTTPVRCSGKVTIVCFTRASDHWNWKGRRLPSAVHRALHHPPALVVLHHLPVQLTVEILRRAQQRAVGAMPRRRSVQLAGAVFGARARMSLQAIDQRLAVLQTVRPVGLELRPSACSKNTDSPCSFPARYFIRAATLPSAFELHQLPVQQPALELGALGQPAIDVGRASAVQPPACCRPCRRHRPQRDNAGYPAGIIVLDPLGHEKEKSSPALYSTHVGPRRSPRRDGARTHPTATPPSTPPPPSPPPSRIPRCR